MDTDGDRGHRIAGWFAVAGGLLLAIPMGGIPFNNMLPSLIIVSAAIAVIERDGLMYAVAVFWVLATIAYFALIASAEHALAKGANAADVAWFALDDLPESQTMRKYVISSAV